MDIDDLDMDQAIIELDKYMSKKLKQPFNISALTDMLNATQDKILIEHHNFEGLHNRQKHFWRHYLTFNFLIWIPWER